MAQRADYLCEYCLVSVESRFLRFHVDHIISIKHSGKTEAPNLAYTCSTCNYFKGTDIVSIVNYPNLEFARLFHPRLDKWHEHFELKDAEISPMTPIGKVTANILQFNTSQRIKDREQLITLGEYPSAAAILRMFP